MQGVRESPYCRAKWIGFEEYAALGGGMSIETLAYMGSESWNEFWEAGHLENQSKACWKFSQVNWSCMEGEKK